MTIHGKTISIMKRAKKRHSREGRYVNVSTKVRHKDKAMLDLIAEQFGMSLYQLLRFLLFSFMRRYNHSSDVIDELREHTTGIGRGGDKGTIINKKL